MLPRYDAVVVGGGPAGLSAATYAASDGWDVLCVAKGSGQAMHSPKIENVIGIHGSTGIQFISNAVRQAKLMGAKFKRDTVLSVGNWEKGFRIGMDSGESVFAPMVLIATGAWFRKLDIPSAAPYVGKSLWYGEAYTHHTYTSGQDVVVVGGGNAAAQSVLHLSNICKSVTVLVRAAYPVWSRYLGRDIEQRANVTVMPHTELLNVEGDESVIDRVVIGNTGEGDTIIGEWKRRIINCKAVFVLTGVEPVLPRGLPHGIRLREGRIVTGANFVDWTDEAQETMVRSPMSMESNIPGLFAAGDCRDGMRHGIATALGEGNTVASQWWYHMMDTDPARGQALLTGKPQTLLHRAETSPALDETPIQIPLL